MFGFVSGTWPHLLSGEILNPPRLLGLLQIRKNEFDYASFFFPMLAFSFPQLVRIGPSRLLYSECRNCLAEENKSE